MTEEEKRELRALKVAKVEDLRGWVKKRTRKIKAVWATDERLKTYVMEVARCPERHNVWEICAVVRFFELLERYEWHEKRAKLQINMQERLRHRTDDGLREIRLQPVQAFMVAVPFGIVRKVDVRGKHGERRKAVRRVIRSVVWMVPRKFGKTTLIAGFGVTEFFFGPYDAEVEYLEGDSSAYINTGVNIEEYYKQICEEENCTCRIFKHIADAFATETINSYHYVDCSLRPSHIEAILKSEFLFDLKSFGTKVNPTYGLLGSNKANEDTLKLFPTVQDSMRVCTSIQRLIKEKTGKHVEVMVYGDGCFKDNVSGIWEFADPDVSTFYTEGLDGSPNEIKAKYFIQ